MVFPVLSYANINTLYFGGVSFMGNANQDHRYYHAQEFFQKNAVVMNKNVFQALQNINRTDVHIESGLGLIQSGDAKVLTLSILSESIERLQEKDGIYSFYRVLASVMIFDVVNKKIISNYPIAIKHQELTADTPSADVDRHMFRKIYEGALVNTWVKKFATIPINAASPLHIKIASLTLDDAVVTQLPDRLKYNDIFKVQTAQMFETLLSSNQNVPILPFTIGRLGNKSTGVVARFSDGVSYDLTLPKADFHMDILIRKFKQAKIETHAYDGYVFGSFITLTVKESYSGAVFLHSKFNMKNKIVFPKRDKIIIADPWDIYLKTQSNLFATLTKQISERDKSVLKQITNTRNIAQQLTKFQEILEKCRY